MTGIPLNRYEDLIADELCAYQAFLDRGESPAGDSASGRAIPAELLPALDEFRRCLDFLHEARLQAGRFAPDANGAATPRGYALPNRIGRFPILKQLGIGGFGIVFLGLDPDTNRAVAIKVPRPEFLGSDELLERFRQEAAAAAQLDHRNILAIFQSDLQAIPPFIVSPYIEGASLAEWRAAQPEVPPRMAAEIARQLAEGVAHAHQNGVLHRDLKPANVLLARSERDPRPGELPFVPKLTDFGLAKCADFAQHHTRTGMVLGTANYMAPEQAEGRSRDVTESTDVYGLGAILYELLTGAPPFRGENDFETIREIARDEPCAPRSRNSLIPVDLEVICLKCLEKRPASRYASAQGLADDLGRFLQGEPIRARPISSMRRLGKWCRRRPAWAATLAAGLLGLLTLLSVSLWYNSRLSEQLEISEDARETAQRERETADQQRQIARQQAFEMRRRAYVADMRMAQVAWDQSNIPQMLKLLDRYQPRAGEPDLRNFGWWYLWREYHESSRILGKTVDGPVATAMTADGNLAASGGKDGMICLWSLPAGTLQAELRATELSQVHFLNFSPRGDRLVSANDDDTVRIWDVSAGRELLVLRGHTNWVAQAAYAPAGDLIASAGADGTVRLWNPDTGAPLGMLSGHGKAVRCLAFHPSERILATGGRDDTIRLWNLTDLRPDARFTDGTIRLPGSEWACSLAFAPDGNSLLAATRRPGRLWKFSLRGEDLRSEDIRLPQFSTPYHLIWAHDGSVMTGCGGGNICVFDRPPDSGITMLQGHLNVVSSIATPVDRSCLVSGCIDGEIRYWPDLQDRSLIRLPGPARDPSVDAGLGRSRWIQWSGNRLAVDSSEGEVAVLRMPERELERTCPHADGFALSPSGELLLLSSPSGSTTSVRVADGRTLWTLQLPPGVGGRDARFAIDSSESYAAVPCESELIVVPLERPANLHRLSHPQRIIQVQFANGTQGPLAITGCFDGGVRLWDVKSGTLFKHIPDDRRAGAVAIAVSDDQRFFAARLDRKIRVWRLDDFEEIAVIPSNFIPNGIALLEGANILAVAEHDKVILWSVPEEIELLTFDLNGSFAVSPDGKQLAVATSQMIHLLDGTPRDDGTE